VRRIDAAKRTTVVPDSTKVKANPRAVMPSTAASPTAKKPAAAAVRAERADV
jgi:hypothetical protein